MLECVQCVLISGDLQSLADLFEERGTAVNPKIKKLIGQLIASKLEQWTESALASRVSLPKLVEVNWAMHMKKSSTQVSKMDVPSILVEMEIEKDCSRADMPNGTEKIAFELSSEALQTMLDGLGKIRDQLSTMG